MRQGFLGLLRFFSVGIIQQIIHSHLNYLKAKRRVLYLKTQSVPRCKHFSSRL